MSFRFSLTWVVVKKAYIHGLFRTLVLIFYKLFPAQFNLIPIKTTEVRATDYTILMDSVCDFETEPRLLPSKVRSSFPRHKRIVWFVPNWSNVWGGGHFTIFKFAHRMHAVHGVENVLFIYNDRGYYKNTPALERELKTAIPDCKLRVIADINDLPDCDVALATTWQSAYDLRTFSRAKSKFYFMQDYESLFYAGGTAAMQANLSYTFGFTGITGGSWLRSVFESYGGKALHYVFAADRKIFFPNKSVRPNVKRIFFYGRPSTERRAFELGIAGLKLVKQKFPKIEIVIAGLSGLSDPPFPCILLGNLSLAKTGELYRTCDVGIAFSGTNLSYLPVELMACGVPVITNSGPQSEWFCKNNINSLVIDPVPSKILQSVIELEQSLELRKKLVAGGIQTTSSNTWESEIDKIYSYIVENSSL